LPTQSVITPLLRQCCLYTEAEVMSQSYVLRYDLYVVGQHGVLREIKW